MGRTFRNIHIASTNDFPGEKNDKIKGWIEHNGGTFSKEISKEVTHLIASQKAWKHYHPLVKEARRHRTVRIVPLEWLEDSLLSKSKRPLDTTKYEFEQHHLPKTTRKRKAALEEDSEKQAVPGNISTSKLGEQMPQLKAEKMTGKQQPKKRKIMKEKSKKQDLPLSKDERIEISGKELDAACAEFEKEMGVSGYRPYVDSNGFVFLITLVRKDILKNRLEKHRLKVRYAPDFASHRSTFYPIMPENPDHRRKVSDDAVSTGTYEEQWFSRASANHAFGRGYLSQLQASLPACPVPLYYFPKPYPYSQYPVVASSLPRSLRPSNPALRVRIPDPWAQGLQLFEYDPSIATTSTSDSAAPNSNQPKFKSYACYFIYSRPGQRHVQMLAPPGSTFDFAWDMFRKIFEKRVGVDWEKRENAKRHLQPDQGQDDKCGGEDGANDRRWEFWGPLVASREKTDLDEKVPPVEGMESRPSVTVVINTARLTAAEAIDAQSRTPPAGW
ncbi:hypothetical protein A1O1_01669 [Capronia coronata CBS 617.96]|uniref:BRCT domain-containing protein n=1 Tax=Capronia coronata CBS 617.96 TaxID=1182541 RepID=W9YK49_9EURO|nr:uncharacterized protein A1O1_01669 [Capronia coronata CBS 617.96]EXJ93277.1 hypothetical protein A1O1_01669 [Capronia coronata CBS 617.96]